MSRTMLHARVTPRQAAIIEAVAEAEGMDVSNLIRRAVFAFVWGNLELVDMPATERPAVLRLHDFPKIAASLDRAYQRDMQRLGIVSRPECVDCGETFADSHGLSVHRGRKHKVPA